MKRKVYMWLVLLAACITSSTAQRFNDVTLEEVSETAHPEHADAKAAYLVNNCWIWYDLQGDQAELRTKYYKKIKIYNEEGLEEFADFVTNLYNGGNGKERSRGLKAVTHNIEDGKVVTQKLSKGDIFRGEESKNYNFVKFAFPGAKVGSVVEVQYEKHSPYLYSTPKHFFQYDIPVKYSKFTLDSPQYISLSPVATGAIPLQRNDEAGAINDAARVSYSASNVPPMPDDDYVLNIQDYRSSLKFEVHSTYWPGDRKRNFSESWESIGARLLEAESCGDMLKKKVKLAKEFIAETKELPEEERVAATYQYVKSKVTWNKKRGIYASQDPNKTLETGTGSVADINLLLINLLRRVDVDAHPVVTKLRSRGQLNRFYPSLTELGYLIAMATVGESAVMLDASSKYSAMGYLPIRALNLDGLLVKDKSHQIIEIPNNNIGSVKNMAKLTLDTEDLALTGTGAMKLSGYAAVKARIKMDEEEEDEDTQDFEEGGDDDDDDESYSDDESDEDEEDIEEVDLREDVMDVISSTGYEDIEQDIKSEYNGTYYEAVKGIGDEIFVDAFVIQEFSENPFEAEVREFPAFFNTKHDHMYVSIIDIPEGYEVSSVPENLTMTMEGGAGSFIYSTTTDDTKLSVRCVLKIKENTFVPRDYDVLRRFFDAVLDKQEEKIVFKKV